MQFIKQFAPFIILLLLAIVIVGGVLFYRTHTSLNFRILEEEARYSKLATESQEVFTQNAGRILELENVLIETQTLLQESVDENNDLSRDLRREKNKNEEFEDQIDKIGSTVGILDKLAKTDPELLQKYSKVYFLNEHYIPPKLTEIPNDFIYSEGGDPEFFHGQAYPYFKKMVEAALDDGVKLWVVSAFRSFDEQRALKGAYTVTYGSGANTFSADQGYSEHQLGTTVDFTTENMGGGLTTSFENTAAYTWLLANAHKYGFVLSYPKNNAYYIFEPWHWRFVGTDLAEDLHEDKKFFYDLDQRKIDEYLVSLFD